MRRKGFMLMEFLVYLAIFSIIMLALSGMVAQLWLPAMSCTRKQTCLIDLVTAHDCFMGDIRMAKAEKIFWKYTSDHAIVFKSGWRDIGWYVQDGDLIRIVGNFNAKKNIWDTQTKSLIVRNIDRVVFALEGEPEVRSLVFTFGKDGEDSTSEVAIINGTIPWKIKKP